MSLIFYCEEEENDREESINNYKDLFSIYENNMPNLSDALKQMFKSAKLNDEKVNELINDILNKCRIVIDPNFSKIKKQYNNISKDDAYIICAYTCESKDKKYSPYKILNKNMVSVDRKNGIENISKYLFIFLKSLRKLPRYYPPKENNNLYRCISCKISLSKDPFNEKFVPYLTGNKKTFWGFTSTSSNPKITFNFLNNDQTIKSGTLFTLTGDVWGYDIQLFNYFGEKEILLEPERKFVVSNVIPPLNDIIYVTCNILNTPLILSNDNLNNNYDQFINNSDNNINNYYMNNYNMNNNYNQNNNNFYNSNNNVFGNINNNIFDIGNINMNNNPNPNNFFYCNNNFNYNNFQKNHGIQNQNINNNCFNFDSMNNIINMQINSNNFLNNNINDNINLNNQIFNSPFSGNAQNSQNNNFQEFKLIIEGKSNSLNLFPYVIIRNTSLNNYMDSILQCLLHIPEINAFFLDIYPLKKEPFKKINPSTKTKGALSEAYFNLVLLAFQNSTGKLESYSKKISPDSFYRVTKLLNPKFKSFDFNDSKDLLIFLIQSMHEELNYFGDRKLAVVPKCDERNAQKALEFFMKVNSELNLSIFSCLFYGIIKSETICLNCNNRYFNFQSFQILNFPLNNYTKKFHIYQGFKDYFEKVIMKGDNQYFCQRCQKLSDSEVISNIYDTPPYLIIYLDYGKNKKYTPKEINFGGFIYLSGFTVNSCDKRAYELIGVSSYNKKAGVNNNYITHCKNISKGDKNWYEFNVTSISRVQFEDINKNFPYLLIYKRES